MEARVWSKGIVHGGLRALVLQLANRYSWLLLGCIRGVTDVVDDGGWTPLSEEERGDCEVHQTRMEQTFLSLLTMWSCFIYNLPPSLPPPPSPPPSLPSSLPPFLPPSLSPPGSNSVFISHSADS